MFYEIIGQYLLKVSKKSKTKSNRNEKIVPGGRRPKRCDN